MCAYLLLFEEERHSSHTSKLSTYFYIYILTHNSFNFCFSSSQAQQKSKWKIICRWRLWIEQGLKPIMAVVILEQPLFQPLFQSLNILTLLLYSLQYLCPLLIQLTPFLSMLHPLLCPVRNQQPPAALIPMSPWSKPSSETLWNSFHHVPYTWWRLLLSVWVFYMQTPFV